MTKSKVMSKNVKNQLETEINSIIQFYPNLKKEQNRLWEIVCDNLDLDYEDEINGEIFDTIMEQYK